MSGYRGQSVFAVCHLQLLLYGVGGGGSRAKRGVAEMGCYLRCGQGCKELMGMQVPLPREAMRAVGNRDERARCYSSEARASGRGEDICGVLVTKR